MAPVRVGHLVSGRSVFYFSVSWRPPAPPEGPAPLNKKNKKTRHRRNFVVGLQSRETKRDWDCSATRAGT